MFITGKKTTPNGSKQKICLFQKKTNFIEIIHVLLLKSDIYNKYISKPLRENGSAHRLALHLETTPAKKQMTGEGGPRPGSVPAAECSLADVEAAELDRVRWGRPIGAWVSLKKKQNSIG